MFRSDSPFGNDTSSYAGSIQSNGYLTTNLDEVPPQTSGLSRPSAKSIYLQRKEYAASANKMMDSFQYRVEHLYTCVLDGKELRNLSDCVQRLKLLEELGRVWGQTMLMQVRGLNLLLTDTETKEELESIALGDILELKAEQNSGTPSSLLIMSVKPGTKKSSSVFMFQCEDVTADCIRRNLSQVLSRRRDNPSLYGEIENHSNAAPRQQRPAGHPGPRGYEESNEPEEQRNLSSSEEFMHPADLDKSVEILNHILNDVEVLMGKVAAAAAKHSKKKKKNKKGKVMDGLPPAEEFAACFHKIKCGFNILGVLNGKIDDPSAPDFVHVLFNTLAFLTSHCPEALPPTIMEPSLTPQSVDLMSEVVTAEEDQLWQSLGEAWTVPSTKWREDEEDIPEYTPDFSEGWQPPELTAPLEPASRRQSPAPAGRQTSGNWSPQYHRPNSRSSESQPRHVRVMYDFISRNQRELTVTKGEIVELLDVSKQWWKVRNSRAEEGFVPNNVLEAQDEPFNEETGLPVLAKRSKPAEVKAWLEDKGFSRITVRCLGGLSGSMLLDMSREELKTLCPEEGGRVFYELQEVKSDMAQ